MQLPAGLVRDPSGVVTKDPNQEVQDRVALVFNSFLQLRTARRVTRVLREHDLALPRNDRHGEVYWARPTVAAVTSMLKNPAYAGVFAYGRTHAREAAVPGGQQNQVRRPAGECRIMVRDRYPAYVGWETHEKIQTMLRDNRAEYAKLQTRGVPRDGAALLHCLIDKVVLRRVARDAASVRVVWRGGAVSELTVALPVNSLAALPRGAEMEARVLELARAGMHDEEIAQVLAAEGHRSPGLDEGVLPATARTIRLRHGIKVMRRCTRWPRAPGWLTVADVALQLQVPQRWLRERLWAGAIQTTREPSGRYLLPDRPDTLDALRQLRAGTIRNIDPTRSS